MTKIFFEIFLNKQIISVITMWKYNLKYSFCKYTHIHTYNIYVPISLLLAILFESKVLNYDTRIQKLYIFFHIEALNWFIRLFECSMDFLFCCWLFLLFLEYSVFNENFRFFQTSFEFRLRNNLVESMK